LTPQAVCLGIGQLTFVAARAQPASSGPAEIAYSLLNDLSYYPDETLAG